MTTDLVQQVLQNAVPRTFSSKQEIWDEIQHISHDLLRKYLTPTPLRRSQWVSDHVGGNVYFKLESLHPTGSFKVRGGLNAVSRLVACHRSSDKPLKICAASAGNHAQGVAYAGKLLGCEVDIFLPIFAPLVKCESTKRLGANTHLVGDSIEDAMHAALEFAENNGAHFIHPFNHSDIIMGQATCAYEAYEQWCKTVVKHEESVKNGKKPNLDFFVCSIGGGGLASGTGIFFDSHPDKLKTKILGVEQEYYAITKDSLKAGELRRADPKGHSTIADGIAVKSLGNLTLNYLQRHIEDVFSVSEDSIVRAMLSLQEKEHLVVEGAGAASVAYIIENPKKFRGKNTIVTVSGGNVDPQLFARVTARGLTLTDRFLKVTASVADRPGGLKKLLDTIAELGGNILDLIHDRTYSDVLVGDVDVNVSVETRNKEHKQLLLQTLEARGFRPRLERKIK